MFSGVEIQPDRFADEFRAFAAEEAAGGVPRDAVMFYGSSSIRLWPDLRADFPGCTLVQRGFGGSTLAECVAEIDRLVFPVQPRAMVLYAGDNDIESGASAAHVANRFRVLMGRWRMTFPAAPLVILSVKPSPCRMHLIDTIRETNRLLAGIAAQSPGCHWVDVFAEMMGDNGWPRMEYFCEDWLHLSPAGYALWRDRVGPVLRELGLMP